MTDDRQRRSTAVHLVDLEHLREAADAPLGTAESIEIPVVFFALAVRRALRQLRVFDCGGFCLLLAEDLGPGAVGRQQLVGEVQRDARDERR